MRLCGLRRGAQAEALAEKCRARGLEYVQAEPADTARLLEWARRPVGRKAPRPWCIR